MRIAVVVAVSVLPSGCVFDPPNTRLEVSGVNRTVSDKDVQLQVTFNETGGVLVTHHNGTHRLAPREPASWDVGERPCETRREGLLRVEMLFENGTVASVTEPWTKDGCSRQHFSFVLYADHVDASKFYVD